MRGSERRPAPWSQVGIGLLLFAAYVLVDVVNHDLGRARHAIARRNGHQIYAFERLLHLDIERPLNAWLAPHHLLSTLADYEYATTYILSALALLTWVWLRRPDLWRATRDSFVVLNLVAFATFVLYPTAPPRLLPGLGFVDTVTRGGTFGSWGFGPVDLANQLGAMPSLHIAWALWVSVVLARITARRSVQLFSAVHVLVTLYVVLATANHFLLDAVAAIVPIAIGVSYASWRYDGPAGEVIAPSDAFFLHVESTGAPQHVGGLVVLDPADGGPALSDVREVVASSIARLPRFRQRLAPTTSRWRRPRWVDAPDLDLDRHVVERRSTDGMAGAYRIVAELAERPLPHERPLWQVVMVRDVAPGTSALVLVVHHAVADGIGTVMQALSLFEPSIRMRIPAQRSLSGARRAAAVVTGLAQLATDGGAGVLENSSLTRGFAALDVPLRDVRRVASAHHVRVSDLVIALAADGVRTVAPALVAQTRGTLCCSVPLMVRSPESTAEGNATAAVMVQVPLDEMPFERLLDEVADRTRRLRRPTRAVASRFVMAVGLRALPEPCAAWFARTVYGSRFLHAVVSNMPGPMEPLTFVKVPLSRVYPILPVAPATPLSLGALSWNGTFGIGLATDAAMLDADALAGRMREVLTRLIPEVTPGTATRARGTSWRGTADPPGRRRGAPAASPTGSAPSGDAR